MGTPISQYDRERTPQFKDLDCVTREQYYELGMYDRVEPMTRHTLNGNGLVQARLDSPSLTGIADIGPMY